MLNLPVIPIIIFLLIGTIVMLKPGIADLFEAMGVMVMAIAIFILLCVVIIII